MDDSYEATAHLFSTYGKVFFDVGTIRKGIMRRLVRFLGSPSEAKYIEYESSLTIPDGCKIITVDKVVSLHEPLPRCPKFRTLADVAESFAQENGYLDYKIKIRNLEDEAKDDEEESGVSDAETSDDWRYDEESGYVLCDVNYKSK